VHGLIVKVSASQLYEDVFEAGMPGRQAGQLAAALAKPLQQ
jgi:hypothetical protein